MRLEPGGSLDVIVHRCVWGLIICTLLLTVKREFRALGLPCLPGWPVRHRLMGLPRGDAAQALDYRIIVLALLVLSVDTLWALHKSA